MALICKAVWHRRCDRAWCDRGWRPATLNFITQHASIKTVNMQSRNFSNLFRHVLYLKYFHYFLGCFSVTGPDPLARPPQFFFFFYKNKLKIKNNQIQNSSFISVSFTSVKWCHFLWVIPLKGLLHTFYIEFYVNVTGLTDNMGTVVK